MRDPALGVDVADQRRPPVRRRARDLHLLDPDRDRPARRTSTARRAGSRSRSRSTSRPTGPTRVSVTAGGDPPVAPATETLTFDTADPYAVETEAFGAAVLAGGPVPTPPEDAVANLRVIERLFAAGAI